MVNMSVNNVTVAVVGTLTMAGNSALTILVLPLPFIAARGASQKIIVQ